VIVTGAHDLWENREPSEILGRSRHCEWEVPSYPLDLLGRIRSW